MWVADEDVTLEGLGTGVAPARTGRASGRCTSARCRRGCATAWRPHRGGSCWSRSWSSSAPSASARSPPGPSSRASTRPRPPAARPSRCWSRPRICTPSLSDANATVATGAPIGWCRNGGEPESVPRATCRHLSNALSALTREAGTAASAPVGAQHDRRLSCRLQRADRVRAGEQPAEVPDRRRLPARPRSLMTIDQDASGGRPSLPTEAERLADDYRTGTVERDR